MTSDREEAVEALTELIAACPEMRIGQLVANLSYVARGYTQESIWDMEDHELLAATRRFLEKVRALETAPA